MISETVGNIYTSLENKFYAVFDFLEEKGLPVYSIIDPIEEKGIPFFPLTIGLIAILLVAVFGFGVVGTDFESSIELQLLDDYGKGLSAVNIEVEDATGQKLFSETKNNADTIKIKVSGGAELTFTAEKEGFKGSTTKIKVINKEETVTLNLKKIIDTIKAQIRFFDEETETAVSDVRATIEWKGIIKDAVSDEDGLVEFLDIPLEEDLYLIAVADSYYEKTASIRFESEETKSVYLTPKEIAFTGESNLIITLFDEEGNLIENAKVKVFDALSNGLIDEKITEDGVYSENFPKGMVLRFTAEKEGFKLFESNEFTLRGEEENFGAIELEKGGKEIQIKAVYSDTKNPVVGAKITLFNSENRIVNSSTTLYEGLTEFKGLDEEEMYFIGAEKTGYLPAIKRVENDSEEIELVKANSSNSGELNVIVVDEQENAVANAFLYFTQNKEEEIEFIPLGIGVKQTGKTGKFSSTVPLNTEITVNAVKDLLTGRESLKIIDPTNNNMLIRLEKKDSVKSIKFFDEQGQILKGNLIIKGKNGEILFDGNVEEEVLFDAGESNFAEVELTTEDGKKYSEEINLEGKTDITVDLDAREFNEKTPEIEFTGIYDIAGNEVEGITKGKEFILKFQTTWSKGLEKGGLHFRTGSDSIKYADSENIGITGFDGATNKFFYGRSYTPTPSPGYKEIDYSNSGQGGKLNKFIELYYTEPEGTKIIKVRIKARETISQEIIRVKFRAWSEADGYYNRNPFDSALEKARETEEKESLYADTKEIEIKVYDSEPECMEEICVEYKLVSEDGRTYDKKEFFGLTGKVYALEMKLEARKSTEATFKLNTSNENPRIAFTGSETGSFSQFIDNNKSDTLISFKTTVSREGTKARIYFKAKEQGESFIKSLIVSPKDSMTENFYFKIFEEREMELTAPESINQGQDFSVTVKDTEGKGIENAVIVFYNAKGRIEKTVLADEFNGKNGKYSIENNLAPGKYLIKVKSDKFKEEEKEIQIVFGKGLEIEETIEINIPANEIFASKRVKIKNSTDKIIEALAAEIVPAGNFPKEFKLSVNVPGALNSNEENTIEVIVEYSGNVKAVLHGEAEVILTGLIEGIPVKTKTRVKINFNQQLNEECLEFDRSELKEYLIGSGGNSRQMELGLKNNCGIPLEFELKAVPKGHSDSEIEFSTGIIRIAKDEIKTINIGVINKIQRNFMAQTTLEYDLFFNSSQLSKSIPVKIILWHEMFALEVSPAIILWLTQSKKGVEAVAAQPLFIRNTGLADIQNLTFATQFDKPGNTKIKVTYGYTPDRGIPELKRGMGLIPPAVIEARTDTSENQRIIGNLIVTGTINGREYALRQINVFVNVSSGWSCLEAWSDDMQFYSPTADGHAIDKYLNIVNNCEEPVEIIGVEPDKIGGNEISLVDSGYVLQPETKDTFILRLTKKAETNKKVKLKVVGIGQRSFPAKEIHSMPFEIDIAIGKGSGICGSETEPCKWENTTTLEYCDKEGTATVYFPKQSSNCSEGYCDAEQLGKFLAEKIEEEIRKAQMRISDVKSVENLGAKCNLREEYCSFGALGVSASAFDFYFKNDNLTKEMLQNEMKKLGAKELQSVYINYGSTEEELYSSAGSSFGEHLLLLPSIRGCGRYKAKLIGAVAINGNEIRSNSTSLLIKLEENEEGKIREETPECRNLIQNFMNFLPVDESYTPSTANGSWLGLIIEDPKIEELQKRFSKTLFKDEEGSRVTTNKENNFIRFHKGDFDQTKGIVKIGMWKSGSSDAPKQLDVYMTDKFFDAGEEMEKDIAAEAGIIISNLKNGVIKEGCISENEDYLILGKVESIAKIANLRWKETEEFINLYPNTFSCAKLKMSSKLDAPEAEVSWSLVSDELKGVLEEETVFRYPEGEEITNKGEKGFNLSKLRWKEEGNNYEVEFQLCFKATDNPKAAKDSKIKLHVTGLEDKTLKFGVCAISPIEFYKRSQSIKEKGTWYATVDWKGEPEKVPLQVLRDTYYLDHPEESPAGIREKELGERKTKGLIGYSIGSLAACGTVSAFTMGVGIGMLADCLINTAVPVGIAAFSSEEQVTTAALNGVKNGLKSIGVNVGEAEKIQEGAEMSDSRFFWETQLILGETVTAKETLKQLVPASKEAREAARAARLGEGIVDIDELKKQITALKTEAEAYNNGKILINETEGITRIGVDVKETIHPKTGVVTRRVETKFIEAPKVGKTGAKLKTLMKYKEGTKEFTALRQKLIDSLDGIEMTVNKGKFVDAAFTEKAIMADQILDDAASLEGGLLKRMEAVSDGLKKNISNTKAGKDFAKTIDESVGKAAKDLQKGDPINPTKSLDDLASGLTKGIDEGSSLKAWATKHPKLSRLGKGLLGGVAAFVGGSLGWMVANAFSGPLEETPTPGTEDADSIWFERGRTYKVKIRTGHKSGKPTYTFSLVKEEDLANIPLDKRLDQDKTEEGICNQEIKKLSDEFKEKLKEWEERQANK